MRERAAKDDDLRRFISAYQKRLRHESERVINLQYAFVLDGAQRAQQVLVCTHSARYAVHDYSDRFNRHGSTMYHELGS